MNRTRTVLAMVAVTAVALLSACDATPRANVYAVGDSNWPADELVTTMHLRDSPYLTIIDSWPGLGVVRDDQPYGDEFAARRLAATIDAAPVGYIVTNFGGNDALYPTGDVVDAARRFLDAADGTPIIWITPAAAGPNAANLAAFGDALVQLEAEYPNLWAVPFDALLVHIGGCPMVTAGYAASMGPIDACYVNRATDVHLSEHGRLVLAATARVAVDRATDGNWRSDLRGDASALVAAVMAGA